MRRPLSTALEPSQRLSHFAARGHEFWQGWHFRLEDLRATRQSDPESRATVTSDIVPIREEHIAGFHAALDAVARERKYLSFLAAPPIERTAAFVRSNIQKGNPQLVAADGATVVGWCDVTPLERETDKHGGTLGMGIVRGWRGKGIGETLIRRTPAAARDFGLHRIELTVYTDNPLAKALYEKVGFKMEGIKRRAARFSDREVDVIMMALLFDEAR